MLKGAGSSEGQPTISKNIITTHKNYYIIFIVFLNNSNGYILHYGSNMWEVRRRTRVEGAFQEDNSALMLVAARLRHIAATKWGTRRSLNMNLIKEMEVEKEIAA